MTNAPGSKLSLHQAVLTYRDEWLIERNFGRFKGFPLSITPFFVQLDDQVKGLVHLLSLAVRLLSLIEFVVRRHLQQTGESLKEPMPAAKDEQLDQDSVGHMVQFASLYNL